LKLYPARTVVRGLAMNRRAVLLIIAALSLGACAGDPDEAALRERIDTLQSAGEAGEIGALMDAIADDFIGQGGNYDRLQLRAMLMALTRRYRDVGVTRLGTEVELRGAHASATLQLLLTGGSGGVLPERGRALELETRWRVEGGQWMLIEARWSGDLGY
jgi:hypothetical protein